jgi:uncharacterized protein YkwD
MKPILFAVLLLCLTVPAMAADSFTNEITVENVVTLMNDYRAARGVAPLRADAQLMTAANDRMRHMEDESYWNHDSPDGVTPFVWLKVRDYDYQYAGENLATGFETARLLVESWMESPGHRDNILSTDFEDCGIAIIDGTTTGPGNGKSVVVLFGATRSPDRASKQP